MGYLMYYSAFFIFQILGQKLVKFFIVILVQAMTPKGHFEINWPLVAVVRKSKATEREAKTMLSQTIRPFLVLTRCICCHPWRLVLSQNSEKLLLSLFSLCVSSPRRLIFRRIVRFFNIFEQRKSLRKKRHVLKALAFLKNFIYAYVWF